MLKKYASLLIVIFMIGNGSTDEYPQYHQLIAQLSKFSAQEREWHGISKTEDDANRNVTELITSKGYECEEHVVTTSDGFILGLQRIPHGFLRKNNVRQTADRPVVFLQHGLLDSSATWVMNLANQSLGFILADAGFDVWLGNMRGNTYSRHHVKLEPSDAQFWEWSWDEMAVFDLPAMLNYVLLTTGQSNMTYIGHSQGTLIAFTEFSKNRELAKKVTKFVALGPVYTVGQLKGLARWLVDALPAAEHLFKLFGIHEFLPSGNFVRHLAQTMCRERFSKYLCENFLFLISGFDYKQLNVSRLPVYFSHTPAGTSVQNMVHFAQMTISKSCQAFDYGSEKLNNRHYNQTTPPLYDITSLDVPTYLFSGNRDWLSDPKDVSSLVTKLKCIVSQEVLEEWDHLDFVWSFDAASTLYPNIVKILQNTV